MKAISPTAAKVIRPMVDACTSNGNVETHIVRGSKTISVELLKKITHGKIWIVSNIEDSGIGNPSLVLLEHCDGSGFYPLSIRMGEPDDAPIDFFQYSAAGEPTKLRETNLKQENCAEFCSIFFNGVKK
jgi:hypothetical protein